MVEPPFARNLGEPVRRIWEVGIDDVSQSSYFDGQDD